MILKKESEKKKEKRKRIIIEKKIIQFLDVFFAEFQTNEYRFSLSRHFKSPSKFFSIETHKLIP